MKEFTTESQRAQRRYISFFLCVLCVSAVNLFFRTQSLLAGPDDVRREITKVLDAQAVAWNQGDIPGFMRGYLESESTVFTSNGRVIRGWKSMLERYKQTYGNGAMGVLKFSELEIDVLSKDAVLVLGRWQLRRGNDNPGGVFTLLFRKTKAGWRIVHDHTSNSQ